MLKTPDDIFIQFKIGLAIKRIIDANKAFTLNQSITKSSSHYEINSSYRQMFKNAGLREATVSDIVNGKTNCKAITLVKILASLNCTLEEFGKVFESLSDSEVNRHIKGK